MAKPIGMWIVVLGALAVPAAVSAQHGRISTLQARIDAAAPGARIEISAGSYPGDLVIDRPLHLVGLGRPLLIGAGDGTVITVTAPDVSVEGFDIDGLKGGDLGRDASGILVAAPRATIRDCRVRNTLFGVYLKQAPGSKVERCQIRGIKEKAAGEKGSGIHVWNTDGFTLLDNDIADVRDGVYIQSSPHGTIRGNRAHDLRYGLHYMYSDDNVFEDNVFENGDAGTAIMYSRRLTFRRNQFLRNRGFASVGLLLKSCDDVLAEHNLIADNARGVFIEGSMRSIVRENVIAQSDIALVLFASTLRSQIIGNSFVGNLAPLSLVGRRTDTSIAGNYWSDNDAPDLDGDGRTDAPYRLSSLFDHLRGNLTAADLFSRSFSAAALAAAERTLPVLELVPVVDPSPLARPPRLPVPLERRHADPRPAPAGLTVSASAVAAGACVLWAGRRRRARREAHA
ncbi:MAG TPA: nitrous oxide reductase family maturation protein NosD [Vicinamibacterales bacterium]|nr:nitrous oxide reductase family maturation protein NosD [Vicinamibacterales bacterium]